MTNRHNTEWGPSGQLVYERTYRRTKDDGNPETWYDTVTRVVDGNLGLVPERHHEPSESAALKRLIGTLGILPAGRHLWASGVPGRQFLFNCWHSGWSDSVEDHFEFTFLRLMEGGGVGANYSSEKVSKYGTPGASIDLKILCNPSHPDYQEMLSEGLIDGETSLWDLDGDAWRIRVGDSRQGWAIALSTLLDEAWYGYNANVSEDGNSVYVDVSDVRPKGSPLKQFGGTASGPTPLARMLHETVSVTNRLVREGRAMRPMDAMEIDHAIAQCVVAGGVRRSARMSILPWNDPDIMEFIKCKTDFSSHWTTNISVATDNEFYAALGRGDVKAHEVLEAISDGMLTNGEPGIWNHSLSQEGEYGQVDSTNPCGEIPLEEWEACNLGHINLEYFAPKFPNEKFDIRGATKAARLVTRFLIRATFGDITDSKSRAIMDRNRRIGVGITGYQSAIARMGIRYSESWNSPEVIQILRTLKEAVNDESLKYSKELRIPAPVKVTTVAPTGTISKLAGVTEGIHPIYARYFLRRIRFSDIRPEEVEMVEEYRRHGFKVEPDMYSANTTVVEIPTKEKLVEEVTALGYSEDIVESADEISLNDMLTVQAVIQEFWADNAVSFTANIDASEYTNEKLSDVLDAFGQSVKGTTIMPRNESRPQSPYEAITKERFAEYQAVTVDDSVDESCATGACPIK